MGRSKSLNFTGGCEIGHWRRVGWRDQGGTDLWSGDGDMRPVTCHHRGETNWKMCDMVTTWSFKMPFILLLYPELQTQVLNLIIDH